MCAETKTSTETKDPKPRNILIPVCPVCGEKHIVPDVPGGMRGEYRCRDSTVAYGMNGDYGFTNTRFSGNDVTYHQKWEAAGYPYRAPSYARGFLTNNFGPPSEQSVSVSWSEPPPFTGYNPSPESKVDALLSPDAPTTINSKGGKQSDTGVRMDLIPPKALFRVASILKYGAEKYGEKNWHKIETESHLNHALVHLYAFLAGDTQDDHLGHACCRLQMALERHLMDEEETRAQEEA